MKKKTKKLFMRGFVKSFVYLLFFIILFLAGYQVTAFYLKYKNKSKGGGNDAVSITSEGEAAAVSFNLLFAIDEDAGCLKHMVLEVLNTDTDNLAYVTIPLTSNITLSSELYQEARSKNSDIPQIIKFSELGNYMETADFYEFSQEVLEDYLDVDISYFTVIQNDDFNTIFKKDTEKNCYVYRNTFETEVSDFTEDDIQSYIKDFYEKTDCNLSLSDRLKYASSFAEVDLDEISFVCIPGETLSSNYQIDQDKANELFDKLLDGAGHDEIENLAGNVEAVSVGKNIMILNGSGITGLAAGFQATLEEAGYTVTNIANYESSDVQNTIIQVSEDGMGTDLLQYFKSAEVEAADDMPDNVDIQIILGASEAADN